MLTMPRDTDSKTDNKPERLEKKRKTDVAPAAKRLAANVALPSDRKPFEITTPSPRSGASFRRRYDELERRREALIARLTKLNDSARTHPSYRRAMRLLNETFRRASLAQRIGVLQAATFLLDLMETPPFGLF